MADIVMPRLSDTMEEGTILRWLKSDGDQVRRGEELVEIETDKATMTYESDQEGVLRIVSPAGASHAVGELIATVGEAVEGAGAPASAVPEPTPPDSAGNAPDSGAPAEPTPAPEAPGGGQGANAAAAANATVGADAADAAGQQGDERIKASPLARRIAQQSGVDLHSVTGSGPGGRIVKADLLARTGEGAAGGQPSPAPTQAPAPGPGGTPTAAAAALEGVATAKGETTIVELSRLQQTVARRMAESKATIPDFTLLMDVDMEECVRLRAELKGLARHDSAPAPDATAKAEVPTYNDMVVKASALALREYPRANGSYRDGRLQLHSRVNVGVAVAAQDALVVPTVFDAEEKSLGEISRETRALAERVRAASITPPELGGGTFTVSNLGMYGVRSFTAIINPPQAAILSVGVLEARALVRDEAVVIRHVLTLTLVCDHRILYGAEAAQFLARIRELLEAPASLTL
jgi:pyruvate dehydrogenase E2 component (dihydrolipoamide acetyltransferase)